MILGLVDKTGDRVVGESPATARALASALARSIGVELLDSVSADKGYYRLIGVSITPDSGWVDIYERPSSQPGQPYFFSSVRWICTKLNGGWAVLRRELLLAA